VQWSSCSAPLNGKNSLLSRVFCVILEASFKPHDCSVNMVRNKSKYMMSFSGQQWTEDSQVGRLADGNGDFEGNGIFSKLLLDVSPFCVD